MAVVAMGVAMAVVMVAGVRAVVVRVAGGGVARLRAVDDWWRR